MLVLAGALCLAGLATLAYLQHARGRERARAHRHQRRAEQRARRAADWDEAMRRGK